MVIRMRLKEVLAESGHSRYWLWKQTGIRYATLLKMLNDESSRLELTALEKLCRVLNRQPGDFFTLSPKLKGRSK